LSVSSAGGYFVSKLELGSMRSATAPSKSSLINRCGGAGLSIRRCRRFQLFAQRQGPSPNFPSSAPRLGAGRKL